MLSPDVTAWRHRKLQFEEGELMQKIYRALAQNIAQHDAYEILTPIGLVPHPLIGSVWAANPSGKPSKSLAKVISHAPPAPQHLR